MSRALQPAGASGVTLHASAVAREGRAVLILGRSGAGKSGLVLRLLAFGATLVADDQVHLERHGTTLHASAPPPLLGLVEARGCGLIRVPEVLSSAPVAIAVDLDRAPEARMPQSRDLALLGVDVRLLFGRDVPNLDVVLSVLLRNGHALEDG